MPFLFDDSRITDILHDEMESRAAERNAKMVCSALHRVGAVRPRSKVNSLNSARGEGHP